MNDDKLKEQEIEEIKSIISSNANTNLEKQFQKERNFQHINKIIGLIFIVPYSIIMGTLFAILVLWSINDISSNIGILSIAVVIALIFGLYWICEMINKILIQKSTKN